MSHHVIHILLLDEKILCTHCENISTRILIKNLCKYLNLQRPETVGLLFKDSRGSLQWMDETKYILDHDIDVDHEYIHLIFKIRYVPHHLCFNESNIHQLFLQSVRLLKQNWFITQIDIHSQLTALYILYEYGSDLNETQIDDFIQESKLLVDDRISNTNLLDMIINAYNNYKSKLNNLAGFLFKFLQLTLSFPIVNSKLYVISDSKNQNWILGINSLELALFQLEQYHIPPIKYKMRDIETVMNRGIKIVIDLKFNRNRSLTPSRYSENEMVTIYALTPHQSQCIYTEIQYSRYQYQESSSVYKISDLMKNSHFFKQLDKWLKKYKEKSLNGNESYSHKDIDITLEANLYSENDIESLFGEYSMYNSDIYQRLCQPKPTNPCIDIKPDYQQLVSEEKRLKELLHQKWIQLQELFIEEEKITGIMPSEVLKYFPNGIPKFQRNSKTATLHYYQHGGCAASIRNRLMAMEMVSKQGTKRYLDKSLLSSRSVTDLSTMKSTSPWKTMSESSSSLRSFEGNKSRIIHKSSNNLFFNDSNSSQKNKLPYAAKSNVPSSPKSDAFLSNAQNQIPSTHSSPLIPSQNLKIRNKSNQIKISFS